MRERDLFLESIELIDPEARRRFLDRACRGNKALRDGIDRLLAWHERGAGWLEEPLPETLSAESSRDDRIEEPLPAGPADGADGIALRPDDPSVLGRVQILQALPETSFGRTYSGVVADRALPVIVKTLDPRQVPDPQAAGRFLATAWRLATVRHEGLPAVVAVGERPLPWIAFEKVAVESLADRAGPMSSSSGAPRGKACGLPMPGWRRRSLPGKPIGMGHRRGLPSSHRSRCNRQPSTRSTTAPTFFPSGLSWCSFSPGAHRSTRGPGKGC